MNKLQVILSLYYSNNLFCALKKKILSYGSKKRGNENCERSGRIRPDKVRNRFLLMATIKIIASDTRNKSNLNIKLCGGKKTGRKST